MPNADHAWKLLGLVNEWIRHSDSKAAITLAFTGAMATLLFNLARLVKEQTLLLNSAVVIAALLLGTTALLCGLTLIPRVVHTDGGITPSDSAANRLFYASIHKHFAGRPDAYAQALRDLTADEAEVIRDLAASIHVNASIATAKAVYAKWAVVAALASAAAIAFAAIVVDLTSP